MTTPLHAACYADLRAWLRRKRRAILITAGALGAGCILYYGFTRYSSTPPPQSPPRIRSSELKIDDDEEQEQEQPEEDHLQQHFQGIQVLADTTTLPPVLARFKEGVFSLIDISLITRKLLAGKEGPQALSSGEKQELWQKVKILSFTRAISATWGLALAQLFIRVQLSMLGRRMFISTARDFSHEEEGEEQVGIPLATQERFMSLSDFFLDQGFKLLAQDAEQAVNQVLGDLSLKSLYTFADLRELFVRIREVFDAQRQGNWSRYLLPEQAQQNLQLQTDDELVMELRQVISSPEFGAALSPALELLLDFTMQEVVASFDSEGGASLPLAKLIPPVSSRGALLERADLHRFVEAIAQLPQVKSLCVLVYGNPGA